MNFSLGFSPCPNDTFIFYALLHHKVDTKGHVFSPFIADVEALNQKASESELDLTKISYNAYLDLINAYVLLDSGSALGRNCGPLLISKTDLSMQEIRGQRIAIPGNKTTANFLLDFYLPFEVKKKVAIFSEIESMISSNTVSAGVIIHENRFTYEERGFKLIKDLGSHWEEKSGFPIPLGGIIAKRSIPLQICKEISDIIRSSIEYAYAHQDEVLEYVRRYAQEMEESVMLKHIDLYVNDFSLDLGPEGRSAVLHFIEVAINQNRISTPDSIDPFLS
ncbi:UNVERIFIED_CONTAM: hypothetical protein GTU68_064864 [Idotea baltica]|nr:hypothetical protein [Idotea baltica]